MGANFRKFFLVAIAAGVGARAAPLFFRAPMVAGFCVLPMNFKSPMALTCGSGWSSTPTPKTRRMSVVLSTWT